MSVISWVPEQFLRRSNEIPAIQQWITHPACLYHDNLPAIAGAVPFINGKFVIILGFLLSAARSGRLLFQL
jgi:hypothetical protein